MKGLGQLLSGRDPVNRNGHRSCPASVVLSAFQSPQSPGPSGLSPLTPLLNPLRQEGVWMGEMLLE